MCEAGKVGIWLTPEEATVIHNALELLSSRLELAAIEHLDRIMAEVDAAVARAQEEKPGEAEPEEEPDEDEDDEVRELPGSTEEPVPVEARAWHRITLTF
jgi:hypothetical protein